MGATEQPQVEAEVVREPRSARATALVDVAVAGNTAYAGETFVAPINQLRDAVLNELIVVEATA